MMDRVTLRIPTAQLEEIEKAVENGHFPNRSEAIRAAVREMLERRDFYRRPEAVPRRFR